ncbi:hypothetical protein, partial [Acinetobacter colistiniresistens]|uniref:hypothetical protein n=1 Tax=Acinetobacter colistiniresistens TaxID=280145 RepID=UPI002FE0AFC4
KIRKAVLVEPLKLGGSISKIPCWTEGTSLLPLPNLAASMPPISIANNNLNSNTKNQAIFGLDIA